jgi:magnesium-transporting ATPase (P-type)
MDILAAIALSSEAPVEGELRPERVNLEEDPLVSTYMWRSIYTQLFYQIIVMTAMLYAAPAIFGIEYSLISTPLYIDRTDTTQGGATYRLQHYTFLFQTFMLMNLFNMVNCRVLPSQQDPCFNVFRNLTANWWFWIIFLFELNFQYFLVGYDSLGYVFTTTPLTLTMHLAALGFGIGSLVIGALVKLTSGEWAENLPKVKEVEGENTLKAKLQRRFKTIGNLDQ